MKAIKKIFALLLCFAIVLTGITFSNAEGNEVKAATDVNTDVLNVKVQVATNQTNVMRFVTTVDSLEYKNAGFEVTPEGATSIVYERTTVFERISSDTNGVEYKFSPKVVDPSAAYFMTAKMNVEAGKEYTVRAFVTLKDSDTKVYGPSRCVALEDGRVANQLNVSVDVAENGTLSTVNGAYTASYTNAAGTLVKDVAVEVLTTEAGYANVRLTGADTNLKSATVISILDTTGATVASTIYRNLYTEYTGTPDTSWYDVYLAADSTETEFTIATNADFYGFASLVRNDNTFSGKTAYLVADITCNPEKLELTKGDNYLKWYTEEDGSKSYKAAPTYKWQSIGYRESTGSKTYHQFKGTFDGQMHIISGVYFNDSPLYSGLFGTMNTASVIKNFRLVDSYFTSTINDLGSVAGFTAGTFENIYSNAIVVGQAARIGGMFGTAFGNTTIKQCWYDGVITNKGTANGTRGTGGIIGNTNAGTTNIIDSLNSGTVDTKAINSPYPKSGGIIGETGAGTTATITRCLNAGDILTYSDSCYGGVMVGCISGSTTTVAYSYGKGCIKTWDTLTTERIVGFRQNASNKTGVLKIAYVFGGKDYPASERASYADVPIIALTSSDNYLSEGAKTAMSPFDFVNTWKTVEGSTPILKIFAE